MTHLARPAGRLLISALLLLFGPLASSGSLMAQDEPPRNELSVALGVGANGGTHGTGLNAEVEVTRGSLTGLVRFAEARRGDTEEFSTRTETAEFAALVGMVFRHEMGLWGFALGPATSDLEEVRYGASLAGTGLDFGGTGAASVEGRDVDEGVLGLGFRLSARSYGKTALGATLHGNVNGIRSWVGASVGVWLSTGSGRRDP